MQDQLTEKLHAYLVTNHLDLLISLQEDHRLNPYLDQKVASVKELSESLSAENRPGYVIEALCLEELTRDLRPFRFNYMRNLLQEEFESDYRRMKESGTLTWEIINLTGACEPIFEVFGFCEHNQEDRQMRQAVRDMISEYQNIGG
ncbi:hypothetical protein SAMN05216464_113146 [Mucilaginibacter pineti]|uniref:Uncharacterized protein n=1 Tax=Mucilaginibacter pineti TaxID=1391627 RepID=A0A1G7ISR0_9SPHI|nr:hypothetical protein [Mucilaginibacter pineti]SDF15638.1 hypothetical protein SAMN05216464_113146 [Mucilaginibacter pineti]